MALTPAARFALRLLCCLAGAQGAIAAESTNANIIRWSKGTIEYRKISTGAIAGSEEWMITAHPDGSRTLHTTNRLDPAGTQREVVVRVAENFRPLDLYASFWFQGKWVGTGFLTVENDHLDATVSTPHGHISQRVTVPEKIAIIPHPIAANAWQAGLYDKTKPGPQEITVYDQQTRLPGPGNILGPMRKRALRFVGQEKTTTPAGTFDVGHFRSGNETDIYVTGPDAVVVLFVWPAGDEEYRLNSLQTGR